MSKREAAEAASRLEIELLGEPMGKQGQYAAAFGGINVLQFNTDNSVDVKPLLIDYKIRLGLKTTYFFSLPASLVMAQVFSMNRRPTWVKNLRHSR